MKKLAILAALMAVLNGYEFGSTFDFAEADGLLVLEKSIFSRTDEMKTAVKSKRKNLINRLENISPNVKRPTKPALRDNFFYANTTHQIKEPIVDDEGRVIYPAGFTYNVLDYIKLPVRYVFIDANRRNEIEWLKANGLHDDISTRIVLTAGYYKVALHEFGNDNIFFATDEFLARFEVTKTPTLAQQVGNKLAVREYYVPNLENNTMNVSQYPNIVIDLVNRSGENFDELADKRLQEIYEQKQREWALYENASKENVNETANETK